MTQINRFVLFNLNIMFVLPTRRDGFSVYDIGQTNSVYLMFLAPFRNCEYKTNLDW